MQLNSGSVGKVWQLGEGEHEYTLQGMTVHKQPVICGGKRLNLQSKVDDKVIASVCTYYVEHILWIY